MPGNIFAILRKNDWYLHLKKPFFHPPSWIFTPIWLSLYTLMGISIFIILNHNINQPKSALALFYFALLLIFNTFWSMIFLEFRLFIAGIIAIIILWLITIMTLYYFFLVSYIAGILLIPYFVWISFITIINLSLWRLNKPGYQM